MPGIQMPCSLAYLLEWGRDWEALACVLMLAPAREAAAHFLPHMHR